MPEAALAIDGLGYRYPGGERDVLRGLDLEIEAGELVLVAGRSGCGKTTLLRAASGLVPHFHGGEVAGSVTVAGLDTREHGPGELARVVGFVAQDPETQVVSTTVRAELELPLALRGAGPDASARAVEEAALALGIAELLERTTDSLSGGELQRVALAAALVGRPSLVLLDEPTSQLDPVAGDELISLLRRVNEQWATAVLLCEHRLERCIGAADRVVALEEGAVAFDGSPSRYLAWAGEHDPALTTPAARLFSLAGLRPPPASVKAARRRLRETGLDPKSAPAPGDPDAGTPSGAPSRSRGTAALEAAGLWVELDAGEGPREVLRGVDVAVSAGERVALMGRNGAGKSTLLRCCAGLVGPAAGRLETPGGCALLTQSPGDFLVRERVGDELPGSAGGAALRDAGLAWAAERDPRDISGGERQRLALAIVLAGRQDEVPGLVCLDEPTRGMDPARKAQLADRLRDLAGRGAAVVVATHDVEFAAAFCRRVLLLGPGEVIADGPPEEILAGGWYFATEVARILGAPGAISPEEGARLIRARVEAGADPAELSAGGERAR